MHLPLFKTILIVFIMLMMARSFALADVELSYIDRFDQHQRQSIMQIKDGKVRMETAETGHYSIYDSQQELLYNINTQLEQYIENSPVLIQARVNRVREWRQKLLAYWQSQLSNLSSSQRPLLEERIQTLQALLMQEQQALKSSSHAPPTGQSSQTQYQNTEEKRQVQGFNCDVIQMTYAQKPYREICLAQETKISQDDLKTLNRLFSFMQKISETAQHFSFSQQSIQQTDKKTQPHTQQPLAVFPILDGLIITQTDLNTGMKRELTKLSVKPLPAHLFNIPPHYKGVSPLPDESENQ